MTDFIHDDFLLRSDVARELYHDYAKGAPIFDYHCHLPPDQIAGNKTFKNLYEVWLAGDHYKWRAMRANGVDEKYCTGVTTDYDKFMAYARTVPATLRNPLYHWTHIELKRFFGINRLLDESSARGIWDEANAQLAQMPVHKILEMNRVAVVCTTDDPLDTLEHHRKILADGTLKTAVYPAWRPDKALALDNPTVWNGWMDKLAQSADVGTRDLAGLLMALQKRLNHFHANGCRLSDHGLNRSFAEDCTEAEASRIFVSARTGQAIVPQAADKFRAFLLNWLGQQYHARGWVMQLHLGALRNTNSRALRTLGADSGFDAIGDWPQAADLARFLDRLDSLNKLPKTIVYNLNPADNYVIASIIGCYQDGSVAGKIQFGSGWWFLDQLEGMEWQINALSNLGLLSRFVGMLTDSRSFLSYSRHEYFRRLLCDMLGRDVARGELPNDTKLLGTLVRNICFDNAQTYFPMKPGTVS